MASPLERARRTLLGAHDLRIDTEQLQPTCVAVASNGAFALVGCTDGSVRLAALGSARAAHQLAFLGQLVSRGLNNSLLVTISIADDCRHAFAGAQKGATEALAWDFSAAPVAGGAHEIVDATRQESRSDSKLRGFVACARAAPCDYRLLWCVPGGVQTGSTRLQDQVCLMWSSRFEDSLVASHPFVSALTRYALPPLPNLPEPVPSSSPRPSKRTVQSRPENSTRAPGFGAATIARESVFGSRQNSPRATQNPTLPPRAPPSTPERNSTPTQTTSAFPRNPRPPHSLARISERIRALVHRPPVGIHPS